MNTRVVTISSCIVLIGTVWASSASAAMTATLHAGTDFPSAADFQPFNPYDAGTPTGSERTLTSTRNLSQSFRLASDVEVNEIDIMYVRGLSGATGRLRIFNVADTLAGDITTQFSDAETNGFLLNETFVMPTAPNDNTERTLKLVLSSPLNLPATASPAGYALNLSSDDGTSEVLTWRFGDPGTGGGSGWYADGRVYYDDFISSGSTETRRDGLFALNGDVTGPIVPEPASLALLIVGLGLVAPRRRSW
jgi:hypothetical protein